MRVYFGIRYYRFDLQPAIARFCTFRVCCNRRIHDHRRRAGWLMRPAPKRCLSCHNRRCRLADAVGPHHLIVLVVDDVAMPGVQTCDVESRFDAGDLTRIRDDSVFEAALPSSGGRGWPTSRARVVPSPPLRLSPAPADRRPGTAPRKYGWDAHPR
jgi:hypothetical protein